MKRNYILPFIVISGLFHNAARAQCSSPVPLGSASNMFTIIRNDNNPVAADKNLNTIAFIHRNNASVFGGNSGLLRYDISTNAGTTWTLNQGVLNPVNTHLARYPNMAIYNPSLNTNPSNAYVAYMAATINSATAAWNGLVAGVQQVSGTGLTETYNQPVTIPQLIPHSIVKGAPGVFWAIDQLFGSTTGFAIYKGTWNSSINDIVWATNYTVSPTWNTYSGQNYNISFDPTGQFGWFCINGHINGGPTTAAYYPTLWRTVNGGTSWSGPYTADLSKMGCFSTFISTPSVPSANFEHDLVVDMYGIPHIFTTIMSSSSYALNYNATHWMYDVTMVDSLWAAYPVSVAYGAMGSWGSGVDVAQMWQAPQAARTADGSKVFFTWADNSGYSTGAANSTPNLFTRTFDVVQKKWSAAKDVSSCNTTASGKVLFPHLAPEVLEPSSGVFKLAPVYAEFTVAGDPLQPVNFHFLDNVTYSASEFTIAVPNASVSIAQGNSVLLCPGSSVNVHVTGAGQAYWNNGALSPTITVSSASLNPLIVTAQKNCLVGKDTIAVVNLTVNPTAQTAGVCPGNTLQVTATGNANSYTWTPGQITGSTAILVAGSTPEFTLLAAGDGCVTQQTVGFTLLPTPTVTILGPDTACANNVATYTVTGASTYTWHDGSNGTTFTVVPMHIDLYSVTGEAANTCTNNNQISIMVIPSPTLSPSMSHTAVCAGSSATLVVLGAQSYSWSATNQTNFNVVTPATTATYQVTGWGANGCPDTQDFTVHVNALPSITVTSTKSISCKGEKVILKALGAANYTWTAPVVSTSSSVTGTPTTTMHYVLVGKDANLCVNTLTFTQTVETCPGIQELVRETSVSVYPNPARHKFTISNPLRMPIKIVSQLGQVVRAYGTEDLHSDDTEVTDLPPGIYFVTADRLCIKIIIHD